MNFSAILFICCSLLSTPHYLFAVYPNVRGGISDHTGRWTQDDDESSVEFNDTHDPYQDHDSEFENDVGAPHNLRQYGRANSFGLRNPSRPIDNRNKWAPSSSHHLQSSGIPPDEAFKRAPAIGRKIQSRQENRFRPLKQINPVTVAGLPPDELARAYGPGALPLENEFYDGPDGDSWNELHDYDGSLPPGFAKQPQADQRNGNWHMRLGGKGVGKKASRSRNQWDELDDDKTLAELGMGPGEKSGVRWQPAYVERQNPIPPSAQINTAYGFGLASAAGKTHLDKVAQAHGLLTAQQILPPDKRTYEEFENGYGVQRNGHRRNSLLHPDDMEFDYEQRIPGLKKQGRTGTFTNDAQTRQVRFQPVQGGAGFGAGENERNHQSSLSGHTPRPSFRSRNGEVGPSSTTLSSRWQPKSVSGGSRFEPNKAVFGRKFTPSRDPSKGGLGHSSTAPGFGASADDQTYARDTGHVGRDNRQAGLDGRNGATGGFGLDQQVDTTGGRQSNGVRGFNDPTNTGQFDQENLAGGHGKVDQFGLGQQGGPSNGRRTNVSNGFSPQPTTSTTSQAYGTSQSNTIPGKKQQQAQSKFDTQPQQQASRTAAFGDQNGRTPGFGASGVSIGTIPTRTDPRLAAQQQGNSQPTGDQRQTVPQPQPRPGQTDPRQQQGGLFGNVSKTAKSALDPNTYTDTYSNLQQSAQDATSRLGQKMQDTTSQFGRTANGAFQSAQSGARSQLDSTLKSGANAFNTASGTVKDSVTGFGNTAASAAKGAFGGLGDRFGGGGGAAGGGGIASGFGGQSSTQQKRW